MQVKGIRWKRGWKELIPSKDHEKPGSDSRGCEVGSKLWGAGKAGAVGGKDVGILREPA